MKKSSKVALGLTAGVAAIGLVGIAVVDGDDDEPTQAGVCVDRTTNARVDDEQCQDESRSYNHGWYFIPFGIIAPRIGAPVRGGSFNAPGGTTYVTGGVPRAGGAINPSSIDTSKSTTIRGGFGSKAGGGGS